MAKPLRSEVIAQPSSIQFSHFGVLDAGRQSKSSFFTSITINVLLAFIVVILSLAAKKINDNKPRVITLVDPILLKPAPPIIQPKVLPQPPLPKVVKVVPPKITVPVVKAPEPPKIVKMTQPAPVVAPAPPKRVIAPAAPAAVNLARPQAASVPNNSQHPSAVALGRPDNPIAPSNLPATSAVNLGQRGLPGMPASNTGSGPAASRVNLGSGSPGSSALAGNGTRNIRGVQLGISGGTGPNNSTGRVAGPVNLGVANTPTRPEPQTTVATSRTAPKVIYKPRPEYTAEARALHLEGTVSVRLRVSASGSVQVLGVMSGLGHGLDQAAEAAVRSTRFQPAKDASGNPVDWEGVVNVAFQLAS